MVRWWWWESDRLVIALTRGHIRARHKIAFLLNRRLAQIIHLAARDQIFGPIGNGTDHASAGIDAGLRHQRLQLALSLGDLFRLSGNVGASVEYELVGRDQQPRHIIIRNAGIGASREQRGKRGQQNHMKSQVHRHFI